MASRKRPLGGLQLPLLPPESDWRPPRVEDLPQDWNVFSRVSLDTETKDPDLRELGCGARRPGCYIAGLSFALEDGPRHYIPIRHHGGDNMENPTQALDYLRHQIRGFRGTVVGANISYDLDMMSEEDIWPDEAKWIRDVQVADPLIYELHDHYSLQAIAERHGLPGKDTELLKRAAQEYGVDHKRDMWMLPARYVGAYAEQDAVEPLNIMRRQERLISELELWPIFDLESQVTPVLVRMRRRGVLVDFQHLQRMEDWSLEQEKLALDEVERLTGYQVGVGNVWQGEAMAEPLRRIGVSIPVTSLGKDSVGKDLFATIDHPVARHLHWARKVNKLRTTFTQSVRRYMINGRVHCTFNQIAREDEKGDQRGARYGRLSSTDPNLQQQPSREDDMLVKFGYPKYAKEWRKVYIPEPGCLWDSADFSQQEPRWTTHFAAIFPFKESHIREAAQEAARRYREDPSTDNHDMMTRIVHGDAAVDAMSKDDFKRFRGYCKNIYLGLCYGEGGAKLSRDLGLSTRWAMAMKMSGRREVFYYPDEETARASASCHEEAFVWEAAGEEAQRILDQFTTSAPHIPALAKEATKLVKRRGYVTTGGGRRLNFKRGADGEYQYTHKALNRVIQGTSADQVKRALVEIDRAGYFLQLQVHDEIVNSIGHPDEAAGIEEIMRDCMKAVVPFKVDSELGRSWGHSMS